MKQKTYSSKVFLDVDEAIEVLDKNDHKIAKQEQEALSRDINMSEDFSKEYQEAYKKHFPPQEGGWWPSTSSNA